VGEITLSNAIRNNLLSLQGTADLLGKTQSRLATGKKVNSALDNPTNFFTASALQSRSSDITRLLDSVSNGVQTLKAADTGIKSLTKLVENAQATARQALQAPKGDYEYAKAEVLGTVALSADTAAKAQGTAAVAADVSVARGTIDLGTDVAGKATGTRTGLTNATTLASLGIATLDTFTVDVGAGPVTVSFESVPDGTAGVVEVDADGTVADFMTAFNAATDLNGVTASLDSDGALTFTADNNTTDFTLAAGVGTPLTDLGHAAGTTESSNAVLAGLVAAGETLVIDDGTLPVTIAFGTDAGEVSNSRDLLSLINAAAVDVEASIEDNKLVLTRNAGTLTSPLTLAGGAALATLGLLPASELESTTFAALEGKKLTVSVNDGATVEFTLGTKAGQVGSQDELKKRLDEIEGISASFTSGLLKIEGDTTKDKVRLGGDEEALASIGLAGQTYSASNTDLDDLSGRQIEVSVGTQRKTITFGQDAGVGQVNSIAELSKALEEVGAELTTQAETTGTPPVTKYKLNLTTSEKNESKNISVSDTSDSYALARLGIAKGTTESKVTAIIDNNSRRESLEKDFNDLLKQVDRLAKDASYNGVNLLDGDDLTVIFNEDGSSKLDISGTTFDAKGLGLEELTPNDFQDDNKIDAVLSKIDESLGNLRSQASRFGSQLSVVETRKEFSKELVNVLETGAANLTLADTNEEAANVLALQTRQQLSTSALSLTSQAEQGILRLF